MQVNDHWGPLGSGTGSKPALIPHSRQLTQVQYTWTRDSALTMLTISSRFLPAHYLRPWLSRSLEYEEDEYDEQVEGTGDSLVEPLIRDYVQLQQRIQMKPTRSGDMWTGGLNEPKFHVDGSVYDGDWGRPQR